jgi:hypothetical protein
LRSRSLVLLLLAAAAIACGDPAHDQAVSALGGEKGGVEPGPNHRPGQPCVVCHGGSGPASAQFSIGGTVFAIKGQPDPLVNAIVHITDSKGSTQDVTTNQAGNFYIPLSKWAPSYPLMKISIDCGPLTSQSPYTCGTGDANTPPATATMNTHVGREGSCAACHFGVPGPATRGPIYLATDPTDLPGAPPAP